MTDGPTDGPKEITKLDGKDKINVIGEKKIIFLPRCYLKINVMTFFEIEFIDDGSQLSRKET